MTFLSAVLLAALAPARDATFEARLGATYDAAGPGLAARFESATRALDEERLDEAAAGFLELTEKAPTVSAGFRRLALVRSEQGRHDDAVALAERAFALEADGYNSVGLATALARRKKSPSIGPSDLARAAVLTNRALNAASVGSRDWVTAKTLSCQITMNAGIDAEASTCVESLLAHDDSPVSNMLGIGAAAARGDFAVARERLNKGRAAMAPEETRRIERLLDDHEPFMSRWAATLLSVGVGWLAILAAMAVLGLGLSALTLAAARRLATQKQHHASTATGVLRAVYRAVLALASVLYYVSLPFVALAVLGLFGGLVWACFAVGRIPIKLVLIAVVIGGSSLIALLRSLFVRVNDEDPGLKLDWARAPRLKAVVDAVAARVGTRSVDTVFITPGTDFAVFERGSYLSKLRGHAERCLIVGRGVLDGFEVPGFQSVLAHEFGHFSNQDTAGGGMALVGRRSLLTMGRALAESGVAAWYNPAWLFFRGYFAIYLRISQGASRLQEVLADRVAIFTYGSAAFAAGYRHYIEQSARFDSHVNRTIKQVIDEKRPLGNLYRFAPAAPEASDEIAEAVRVALERPPGPYDSHPSSKDRLGWAAALDLPAVVEAKSGELVLALFDDLEALEREMTLQVRVAVATNHEVVIADEPATQNSSS